MFTARTTRSHNTHQISLTLPSSFPFCPHTRPCPFRLHCPSVLSLGVLNFKSQSIAQQPFGLHAAHPRNSSLSLGSARVVLAFLRPPCPELLRLAPSGPDSFQVIKISLLSAFLRPRLALCFFCAGTAAAQQQATSTPGSDRLKSVLFMFRVRLMRLNVPVKKEPENRGSSEKQPKPKDDAATS